MSEMNDPEYRFRFRKQVFWTGIGFYLFIIGLIALMATVLAHKIK